MFLAPLGLARFRKFFCALRSSLAAAAFSSSLRESFCFSLSACTAGIAFDTLFNASANLPARRIFFWVLTVLFRDSFGDASEFGT